MSSTVLSVAKLDFSELETVYLQVDMEYDNRKNAAFAVLSKLSRDILHTCLSLGGCLANPERNLCSIMMIINSEQLKNEELVEFFKAQRIFEIFGKGAANNEQGAAESGKLLIVASFGIMGWARIRQGISTAPTCDRKKKVKIKKECDSFAVEQCLSFTIFYLMEKVDWFRIGDSFVQGDFLSWKKNNIPKIQIKTHCSSSGEIYINFLAEMIRVYPFEHWILDPEERFTDLNSGPITHEIRPRWISCLPKLGKGRIVRVHRRIPETSPFETYAQMKAYWKKTYGYDLPAAEPEVFYDVKFNNGQTMLYPLCCVLSAAPEVIPVRANSTYTKEALALFLKAFKDASIVVCGKPLISEEKESLAVKSYMEVISMQAVNPSRLKKEQKVTRKKEGEQHIRKVYPKIPAGVKRSISSSSDEPSSSASKKSRPGFNIDCD
ncbi:unnamed protein product [Caenorhabditis sp. 36 PRJEB53466]|nr:unnamed protein product [Caenorhabditis sp. 36 PRJEB53466]